jgi:integrase
MASLLAVVVPIARNSTSRWCPVTTLEEWLDELAADGAGETVWPWITKGDTYRAGYPPIGPAALDSLVSRRVRAAGLADADSFSPHSLRAGFVTEAKNRGIDEADIMRHTRIKSLRIMRSYDRESGWWLRNPTTSMTL